MPPTIFSCQSPNFAVPLVFLEGIAKISFVSNFLPVFHIFFLPRILFWLPLRHHSLNICYFLSLSIFLLSPYYFCQLHKFPATPTFFPASYHIILPLFIFRSTFAFSCQLLYFRIHLSHIAVPLTFPSISNILLSISRFF